MNKAAGRTIAAIAAGLVALTACAPPDAGESPGYVSGDGTVTEWAVAERGWLAGL